MMFWIYATSVAAAGTVTLCAPERARIEYEAAPLGLDVQTARFSWALCAEGSPRGLSQAAYSIEVHDVDAKKLLWASGTVMSNRSTNVRYGGTERLPADGAFAWRVQWWSGEDMTAPSPWTEKSSFTTGLFADSDWKGAEWITMGKSVSPDHVLLRSPSFQLPSGKTIARAAAYVVGLGYYHLYVDGTKLSTHALGAFTTFEKRVLYDTWDATSLFASESSAVSEHVVAVEVGPGYYTQKTVNPNRVKLCRLRLSLKFTDGTVMDVVTSAANGASGWSVAEGPITHTDIYDGEYVDMRANDDSWNAVVPSPASPLKWQAADAAAPPTPTTKVTSHAVLPKIGIRESYSPCAMYQSAPGVYVYDFCQNMAGYVTFSMPSGVRPLRSLAALWTRAFFYFFFRRGGENDEKKDSPALI